MAEAVELHNLRLEIMAEVNAKFLEANEKFDEIIRDLDREGTEFSRSLKGEILEMKNKLKNEIENVWSYLKSKLVSIEAGQAMLYDPKDGIMTKVLNRVDAAVKMSRDAAQCTAGASKAAEDAAKSANETRIFVRTNIFVTALTFLGILITVVSFGVSYASKLREDTHNQKAMIAALQEKITQDAANQQQTVNMLDKLYHRLGEKGGQVQ